MVVSLICLLTVKSFLLRIRSPIMPLVNCIMTAKDWSNSCDEWIVWEINLYEIDTYANAAIQVLVCHHYSGVLLFFQIWISIMCLLQITCFVVLIFGLMMKSVKLVLVAIILDCLHYLALSDYQGIIHFSFRNHGSQQHIDMSSMVTVILTLSRYDSCLICLLTVILTFSRWGTFVCFWKWYDVSYNNVVLKRVIEGQEVLNFAV